MPEPNEIPTVHNKSTKLKRKPSKKVLLITLWVVAMVLVGYVSFTISRNNALAANRSVEKALTALKAKDSDTVYELGTDEFKKASSKETVATVVGEWSKVINEATTGEPELVSKKESVKDGKELTTLVYKYQVQPGKSKINQKELFVTVVTQKVGDQHKLYTFNIDTPINQKNKS